MEDLQKIPENSDKWNSIKSEIKRTDRKIDEEVYKLYGLKQKEIKIIEDSLKNYQKNKKNNGDKY